jgi:LmbE family N-acetylglucosaminyl deacetylase
MNVLIIAAHPDDEVLGCGGAIAKLSAEGHGVSILILGEGINSRYARREDAPEALLQAHRARARRAGEILGAREVKLLGLPDQRMDTVPLLDITHAIEAEIARVDPATLFIQHGGDLNMDHVITYRAALTAARPQPGSRVRRVLAYEVASSTEWSFQRFSPVFQASAFCDITPYLERKISALAAYESEVRTFPHPRSPEALRAAAQRWGSVVGVNAAEAFEVVREFL